MKFEKFQNMPNPAITYLRKVFPFLRWWNFIGWDTVRADLIAGLTGAIIVLPQGVAFAMIAGLPPEYGLYTAMVVPLVAALFGSSLHLISGPTTAISIVIFSSLSSITDPGSAEYIRLAITLTFLAGVFQLAFGLARMGILVNFVSHTVIIGFTAGAAILIATSQIKHVFGLYLPGSESFFAEWANIIRKISSINSYALLVAAGTLACAVLLKLYRPRRPRLLIAMIIGSLIAMFLDAESHNIRLMESLPGHLPQFSMPDISLDAIRLLSPKAFPVALIGLIEALSIARSIAAKSRQLIDGNQEFIGQGLPNIFGSFFSCYAGSGSFTRSGINFIDITGAEMLVNEARRRRGLRGDLYLCGLKQNAMDFLKRGGYLDSIGADHIFESETKAVKAILSNIDNPECRKCQSPLYKECKNKGRNHV